MSMIQAKNLDGLTPEQYGSRKAKAVDIQVLNNIFFMISSGKR